MGESKQSEATLRTWLVKTENTTETIEAHEMQVSPFGEKSALGFFLVERPDKSMPPNRKVVAVFAPGCWRSCIEKTGKAK